MNEEQLVQSGYYDDPPEVMIRYEEETGEKAMYRKGSSDYHTLKYVTWLEDQYQRTDRQNLRMREWFKERTGLDSDLLHDHMLEIDFLLKGG